MILRSLKSRIAMLTMGVSAVAVAVALAVSWLVARQQKIAALDNALESCLNEVVGLGLPPEQERFEERGRSDFAGPWGEPAVLLILDEETGEEVFRSDAWPLEAIPGSLAKKARGSVGEQQIMQRLGPPRGQRRGPPPPQDDGPPPHDGERPTIKASLYIHDTILHGGSRMRVAIVATGELTVAAAYSMEAVRRDLAVMAGVMAASLAVTLLLCLAIAPLFVRQALTPVKSLSETMERVSVRGLHQRVDPKEAAEEFRQLIDLFNDMVQRLEKEFQKTQRFTSDAAHELRTPLTVMQGRIEHRLQAAGLTEREQVFLGEMNEELAGLKSLIEKLLLLSLSDARSMSLNLQRVNLTELTREVCDDLVSVDPSHDVRFESAGDVFCMADKRLLLVVVQNLASNAQRYCTPAGAIHIQARTEGNFAELLVSNPSTGIPDDKRELVFDRFYRVDKSRSRQLGGSGLGLALVREIARAHGGSAELVDGSPEKTTFRLRLQVKLG